MKKVRDDFEKRHSSPFALWGAIGTPFPLTIMEIPRGFGRVTLTKATWLPSDDRKKRVLYRKGAVVIVSPSDMAMLKHTGRVEVPAPNFEI